METEKEAKDKVWRELSLEWLYHELCATPQAKFGMALNGFLTALKASRVFARGWAEVMVQAGKETKCELVQRWGERLRDGMAAHQEKRYEEAIPALTALLAETVIQKELKAVALDWRSLWYRWSKQEELALEDLQQAVKFDGETPKYWSDLALIYKNLERYEEAIAAHQRAIELDPKSAYPHSKLGNVYEEQKQYDEAIAAYQRAIELDPKSTFLHYNLGVVYEEKKRFDEAIMAYQRAIELDPKSTFIHHSLGDAYKENKQFDEAITAYQRAIELDSQFPWETTNWSGVYEILTWAGSLQYERSGDYEASLGVLQYQLGDYEASLGAFQKALELKPDNMTFSSNLGYLHLLQGHIDKAQELIEVAINNKLFDRVWLNLGLIQAQQGQVEEAKRSWQQGLNLMEDDSDWDKAVRYVFTSALGYPAAGLEQMQNLIDSGADKVALRNALNDATILSRSQPPLEGIEQMLHLLQKTLSQV